MSYLIEEDIPELYRDFDISEMLGADNLPIIKEKVNFYISQLNSVEKNGHNLYIYSVENGTGKTSLAYYILKQVKQPRIKDGKVDITKIASIKFGDYLNFCLNSFSDDSKIAKRFVKTAPFLLLDDVSSWALTGNPHLDNKEFSLLMMYRREHLLPTIITSNLTPDNFNKVFGATTSSKVKEGFNYIEIRGGDVREVLYSDLFEEGEDKNASNNAVC